MSKRLLILTVLLVTGWQMLFSQQGAISGRVLDKENKEGIPFASVVIETGGKQYAGTTSDMDGKYTIKPLPPGKYDLKATYVGYHPITIRGVVVTADKITFVTLELVSSVKQLDVVEVTDYKVPLIKPDETTSETTMSAEEIEKMPSRSAGAVASTVGGVFTDENGNIGGIRGQRASGTVVYVDGVRTGGTGGIPQSALEQVTVITGGLPAQYGDATGGVINITTKGPSRQFNLGAQYETSELLDHQHYNLLDFFIQGPLIKGRDTTKSTSLLGFFLAGDLASSMASATALDEYTVRKELKAQLEKNPLRPAGDAYGGGIFLNSWFIRKSDLVKVKDKPNSLSRGINLSAKIDVRTTPNTNLTFGGNGSYSNGLGYSRTNSLLNYENNGLGIGYNYKVFGRFTQRFPTEKDNKSLIKNVFYTLQADYTVGKSWSEDATHKDDIFKYGYIGKFTTYRKKSYEFGRDTATGLYGMLHNGYGDTLVDFEQADFNITTGNYTAQYYRMFPRYSGYYRNFQTLQQFTGVLLNGNSPPSVYGLWSNTGSRVSGYGVSSSNQIGVNATGSADIGDHEISFGIIYQQNTYRAYSYGATSLWYLMRQIVNKHILQLDKQNPQVVRDVYGVYQDTINYYRFYNNEEQSFFDRNLRNSMGLKDYGDFSDWKQSFIDIDSYDMNNHTINYYGADGKMHTARLNKDFSIDWFSADDLLNSGNSLVNYFGYDYTGKKLDHKPSFDDFFTKRDAYGNYTREIAPFQPIYMSGYIQDKYNYKEKFFFRVGLRVDRIDLNQKVLKDPYLLYEAKTVKDVNDPWAVIPSNMGQDYVVYVDNINNPTKVLGFRDGDTWFNAQGTEVADPTVLESPSGIQPYLVDPSNQILSSKAFKDYEPQISYMPRIAFSFPISDEANFFAHYDVLTKRPTDATQLDPLAYLYIENAGTSIIGNPNMKPEKTIDYELGFEQKLNNSSKLRISGYYREMRDMVQSFRYYEAYPKTYVSYNNIDFGTVKGLNITYDLRRTNNIWIKASYNLQFADGTGSDASSSLGLVAAGYPNLRTTYPMSFDKRHEIKVTTDYRFAEGQAYNGPKITRRIKGTDDVKTILLLQNTGINLVFRGGSGLPYTARNIVGNTVKGSLNGSRLPWQFAIDARLDKDFKMKINGKKVEGNIYMTVFNVLNTKNILGVYATTGNPDDDGYLSAAQNQNTIRAMIDEQSFRELYSLAIDNPGNYMLPRRIHLGIQFSL